MKLRRILLIMLLPFMAQVLIACCECLEPTVRYYTNANLSVNNLDNTGRDILVATNNSVNKNAFGIRLKLTGEKTAKLKRSNTFFIQTANATSCRCEPSYQVLPRDSIVYIKIYTEKDFNSTHLAGADISSYFKVFKYRLFYTIDDYLKKEDNVFYDDKLERNLDLLLMTGPTNTGSHRFKISILLTDGRIFETSTSQINLT